MRIQLGFPDDGVTRQFRVVRQIWRRKEPRTVLHCVQRVGISSSIDPGTDQSVGVVDAQAVELLQHFADAGCHENQYRTGLAILGVILLGVQHAIVPGLAFRVGAAGRSTHVII